jgi:hypothetical protein
MGSRVYVGNLDPRLEERDIREQVRVHAVDTWVAIADAQPSVSV